MAITDKLIGTWICDYGNGESRLIPVIKDSTDAINPESDLSDGYALFTHSDDSVIIIPLSSVRSLEFKPEKAK